MARGYFYRNPNRGWYTKLRGKAIPLEDENGNRLKAQDTPVHVIKAAYHRVHAHKVKPTEAPETITVNEVCDLYLTHIESGKQSTFTLRRGCLFDFRTGFSKDQFGKPRDESKRIHDGYGDLPVCEVTKPMVTAWLNAHTTYGPGTKRILVQALKRAFNWAAAEERGIIGKNPIKGWKLPEIKSESRITYINDDQEVALTAAAKPSMKIALRVLIKSGLRPSEFCNLIAKNISDDGNAVRIKLQGTETKTKKGRVVPVNNELAKQYIREGIVKYSEGKIFRNSRGKRWTRPILSQAFRAAKRRAEKQGIEFDPECCCYSTRHTYGKRLAMGHGGSQPATIETICRLMGNTPDVARKYLEDNDAGTLTGEMLDRFAPV